MGSDDADDVEGKAVEQIERLHDHGWTAGRHTFASLLPFD